MRNLVLTGEEPLRNAPISILVIDTSIDSLSTIATFLQMRGCAVTGTLLRAVLTRPDPAAWIRAIDAAVVVFNLTMPFEEAWLFYRDLRSDARVRSRFVLTTSNKAALESLTPIRDAIEIVGRPEDLEALRSAINGGSPVEQPIADLAGDRGSHDRRLADRRGRQGVLAWTESGTAADRTE